MCCGGTWGCLHGLDAEEHEALFPAENNTKPCLLFDQKKKKNLCVCSKLCTCTPGVHMRSSRRQYAESDAVLQSGEEVLDKEGKERRAGKRRGGKKEGRLESSPCSLWQSEQEALAKKKSLSPFPEGCC